MKNGHHIIKNIQCNDTFALKVADIARSRCKRPHAQREVKHMVPTNSKYFHDITSALHSRPPKRDMRTVQNAHSCASPHKTDGDINQGDTCALSGLICAAETHQKEHWHGATLPPFSEILGEERNHEKLLVTVSFADLLRLHQNQKVPGE